jgi:urease alpha subunit
MGHTDATDRKKISAVNRSSPTQQPNVNQKMHTIQGKRGKIFSSTTLKFVSSLNLTMSPNPKKKKKKTLVVQLLKIPRVERTEKNGFGNTTRSTI